MDIRMETYNEAVASYLGDVEDKVVAVGDPAEEIAKHGLGLMYSLTVNPRKYPAGTWFYYPGDGTVAVREVARG